MTLSAYITSGHCWPGAERDWYNKQLRYSCFATMYHFGELYSFGYSFSLS